MPQPDLLTLVLNWASAGPSEYASSGPHLDLVTLVPTWTSSGHSSTAWPAGWTHLDLETLGSTWALWGMVPLHGLQVGLTWNWGVGLPPGPHPGMVTQVPTWASFGPGESGPYLVLTRTW